MGSKSIMILGTASSVGKSVVVAGLCRVFKRFGFKVAPFKSQNMALNSFVTKDGDEIGRAQVVQAQACNIEPDVRMNPILLKPNSSKKSQVILNGKVYRDMDAKEYYTFKPKLKEIVKEAYTSLQNDFDLVVLEGAGSPVELNLKENDIVNMGMATLSNSPCILVADIDRGGVFASIVGTVNLLEPQERARIKGIIINKFRGDIAILEPGIKQIEELTGIDVLGVLPYWDLKIDDEDSLSCKLIKNDVKKDDVDIAVLKLPYMSNYTDFNYLESLKGVSIRYCDSVKKLGYPDLIIIPGSKSTINDLLYLRSSGLEDVIIGLNKAHIPIFGICAGMQILGKNITDKENCESPVEEINALGLLEIETTFKKEKILKQTKALADVYGKGVFSSVDGYEIHMGNTKYLKPENSFVKTVSGEIIGVCNDQRNVFGTYLHGILDNKEFCENLLFLIKNKDFSYFGNQDIHNFRSEQYDKLGDYIMENLDMAKLKDIVNEGF